MRGLGRRFGDLKVRPKLIILHNLFFIVLTCGVYFAVIPPFERRVAAAKTIEISLITQIFSEERPLERLPKIEAYNYVKGSAAELQVPLEVVEWLGKHPGEVWQNSSQTDFLFRQDPESELYYRITLSNLIYDEVLERAKITLFLVLGLIYVLAVLLLEKVIMPLYVYRPLRLMLDADSATLRDERQNELIPEPFIPGDEIGQIMRSRNQTVKQLREHEDGLARALASMEAQDRLASLGLLSASVAHELNTPLAVLHGSIEKLLETVQDQPARERLARMLRVTQRLQKISEGLVDFARVRRREMEPVLVRPLMEEAWSLVAIDEKAAGAQFVNEADSGHTVIGNADRLIQVFVNLLRNSVNAVGSGGRVCVTSRQVDRDAKAWIAIAVEDNGPGIPPDVLPDIFDAFVSSRLDARGTGLGLTVAEGIVQQHGGAISASNRPGGGARLEVVLRSAE